MKHIYRNQKKLKRQKRRLSHRSADYNLLSYFSDTILFEYDCDSNILIFTSNITKRFHSKGNRAFQILNPQEPMEMIHPDDADIRLSMSPSRKINSTKFRTEILITFSSSMKSIIPYFTEKGH